MTWYSDDEWARIQAEREEKRRFWEEKEQEFARAADIKRGLIAEMEQLVHRAGEKGISLETRRLTERFKAAGFAGKEVNNDLGDQFYSARDRVYECRNEHFDQLKAEWSRTADERRELIRQLEGVIQMRDYSRQARDRVKEIHGHWKAVGYSGKETKELNDRYYALRGDYYALSNQHWEDWNNRARTTTTYAEELVGKMTTFAELPDPASASGEVHQLIATFRALDGPMKKADRKRINRDFWAAKDRFYARRDLQKSHPERFTRGERTTEADRRFGRRGPDNHDEARAHLDAALSDARARLADARDHHESVARSMHGQPWVFNGDADARLRDAATRVRIAERKVWDLEDRLRRMY